MVFIFPQSVMLDATLAIIAVYTADHANISEV
jgi:hypothetical protein